MKIFISYAREDSEEVEKFVSHLESEPDIDVFWDRKISAGDPFLDTLAKQAMQVDAFIVFLSRSAFSSKYVKPEVFMVHDAGIEIVPVYLEPVPEDYGASGLKLILSDREAIFTYKLDFETSYKKLITAIRRISKSFGKYPIISIMGSKGGVGKSSIIAATAELIAHKGETALIIDADTETGGITEYLSQQARGQAHVWTTLDACFAKQNAQSTKPFVNMGLWDVTPEYLEGESFGKIYLIPGRLRGESRIAYNALADIQPDAKRNKVSLEIIYETINRGRHAGIKFSAILIDCGAENNPLISAGIVTANYPFIVTSPNIRFSEFDRYERMHKQRYPEKYNQSMRVIVNQATEETPNQWRGIPNVYFVREDPIFRLSVAKGKLDFEGVGLNNFYSDVLEVMRSCFKKEHHSLLADPIKIWVEPYIRAMKERNFPEKMLERPKYRSVVLATGAFIIVALVLLVGVLAYSWLRTTNIEVPIAKPEGISDPDYREDLDGIVIPQNIRDYVSMVVSSSTGAETSSVSGKLVVRDPIPQKYLAELQRLNSYAPLTQAIEAAAATSEQLLQQRVTLSIIGFAVSTFLISFGCVRHRNLSKHKRFLTELIRARDEHEHDKLAQLISIIIARKQGSRQLEWLRSVYRSELEVWELDGMFRPARKN